MFNNKMIYNFIRITCFFVILCFPIFATESDEEFFMSFCRMAISHTNIDRSYCYKEWEILKNKEPLTKDDRLMSVAQVLHDVRSAKDFSFYGYILYYNSYLQNRHAKKVGKKLNQFVYKKID